MQRRAECRPKDKCGAYSLCLVYLGLIRSVGALQDGEQIMPRYALTRNVVLHTRSALMETRSNSNVPAFTQQTVHKVLRLYERQLRAMSFCKLEEMLVECY